MTCSDTWSLSKWKSLFTGSLNFMALLIRTELSYSQLFKYGHAIFLSQLRANSAELKWQEGVLNSSGIWSTSCGLKDLRRRVMLAKNVWSNEMKWMGQTWYTMGWNYFSRGTFNFCDSVLFVSFTTNLTHYSGVYQLNSLFNSNIKIEIFSSL